MENFFVYTLFQLLVPLELEPYLGSSSEMLLELNPGTAGIPWELLDTESGRVSQGDLRPWAVRSKLLRKLRLDDFRPGVLDAGTDAAALVIGEPECDPAKYPPLPGARREALSAFGDGSPNSGIVLAVFAIGSLAGGLILGHLAVGPASPRTLGHVRTALCGSPRCRRSWSLCRRRLAPSASPRHWAQHRRSCPSALAGS